MTIGSNASSQRAAAKTAGIAYLLSFPLVVAVNFGIFARLIVADPAQAALNIRAHETLFRVGITGQLLYCLGVLLVSVAYYVILRTVNPLLALIAAIGRIVHGFTWLVVSINFFVALRVLTQPVYAAMLEPAGLPVLARLYLSGFDLYYVGLLFWALGSAVGAWVWLESSSIPKGLAVFGILAGAWCAACTLALFIFPGFPTIVNLWLFDVPMVLFEIALSILLLTRGLRHVLPQ